MRNPQIDLNFFPETRKIEKIKELAANLHDKTEFFIHIRNLNQDLNHKASVKKGTKSK